MMRSCSNSRWRGLHLVIAICAVGVVSSAHAAGSGKRWVEGAKHSARAARKAAKEAYFRVARFYDYGRYQWQRFFEVLKTTKPGSKNIASETHEAAMFKSSMKIREPGAPAGRLAKAEVPESLSQAATIAFAGGGLVLTTIALVSGAPDLAKTAWETALQGDWATFGKTLWALAKSSAGAGAALFSVSGGFHLWKNNLRRKIRAIVLSEAVRLGHQETVGRPAMEWLSRYLSKKATKKQDTPEGGFWQDQLRVVNDAL